MRQGGEGGYAAGMDKSLGDHVAETASNLLPLLGLVFGIFVVLILVLIFIRVKMGAGSGGRKRRGPRGPVDMQPDEVANVLGKTFHVVANAPLEAGGSPSVWCALMGETHPSRVMLARDMSRAVYFPGREEYGEQGSFPEEIAREEGTYRRMQDPVEVEPGWKLATYQGPNERFLAIEAKGRATLLWRGKSIPPEGVTMIEER